MRKKKGPLRTGFWFGTGFMFAAYLVMFLMDNAGQFALMLFGIIMKGLGFEPGPGV